VEMPSTPDDTSWWDDLMAGLSSARGGQVPPPPSPPPPKVDQSAWEKSLEQAKASDHLGTVHDLGLRVFNETQSYSDRPDSSEPLDVAREKMAHVIMNGDQKWGSARQKNASTALPIEPSQEALRNPAIRAAYQSSMKAAREAYLSGSDPTNGAVHIFQATTPDRSNLKYKNGSPEGVPLSTQSGPYSNSYTKGQVPSRTVWLNTYLEK
jgi:hypothetical protein